jgi:hypothetical protein
MQLTPSIDLLFVAFVTLKAGWIGNISPSYIGSLLAERTVNVIVSLSNSPITIGSLSLGGCLSGGKVKFPSVCQGFTICASTTKHR